MNRADIFRFFSVVLILCALSFAPVLPVYGEEEETVDDLKSQIEDRQQKIREIEEQIAKYEEELTKIGANKKSLQNEINQLDTTRKKLNSQISATQNKIYAANLKINQLSMSIADKESSIHRGQTVIAQSLRAINVAESQTLTETILSSEDFSQFWQEADMLGSLQHALREHILVMSDLKTSLSADKDATDKQKKSLISLNQELGGQKSVLDTTRTQRDTVLAQTKSKESEYQKLLAEKIAAKEQFEKELANFEGKLSYESAGIGAQSRFWGASLSVY
jgi:septal ring factor EnvC (AmiA/AmiB activator)